MRLLFRFASIAAAALLAPVFATSAQAADFGTELEPEVPVSVEYREIVFDLGIGVAFTPEFPTSKVYKATPWPIFGLKFLRLPVFGEVVTGKQRVFSLYPSFNAVSERSVSDANYLLGIPTRDFSLELGLGAEVRYGFLRGFVQGRYGVLGHNGFVGEAGVEVIVNPTDRLEVAAGPVIAFADDTYMDEYFSVPNSAVFLAPFNASAGIKNVGVAIEAEYAITEEWRLHGKAAWTRYVGDAENSPITRAGSDDAFVAGIGLTYRFGFDLFDN